ncbi:MAG TPA: HD domain-containing protein [Candidatus Paceibacterota bacterium]|nr:HD domain-containing protein [Candidatus Paceibacterota bacterium]
MRTVEQIYEHYRLPNGLRLHQLRVASVAKMICGSFAGVLDIEDIVRACLFHDMGNILKMDTDKFVGSLWGPEPKAYWERVKEEYIKKYGPSEEEEFNQGIQTAHEIEQQIFERLSIKPESITDESIAPIIEELKGYEVE